MKRKLTERILYLDDIYTESITCLHNIYLKIREYINFCSPGEFEGLHLKESEEGNRILATIQSFFTKLQNRLNQWRRGIAEKRPKNIQNINDNTEDANEDSQNVYNIRLGIENPTKRIYRQLNNIEKIQVKRLSNQYFNCLQDLDSLMQPFSDIGEINRLWPFENQEIVVQIKEWKKENL
jgi:archaellum component FlaC